MKQILTLLAALTCLCAGIAAAGLSDSETPAGVPNPIREYTSISELEKAVVFPVSAPEEIHGFRLTAVSSIDSLAQLIYSDCAQELCFRVSPAARTEGDNSGDYNHYDFARSEEIDSAAVTMKGFGDTRDNIPALLELAQMGVLTLDEAVAAMTCHPAALIAERTGCRFFAEKTGHLGPGALASITVVEPDRKRAVYTIVNGEIVSFESRLVRRGSGAGGWVSRFGMLRRTGVGDLAMTAYQD